MLNDFKGIKQWINHHPSTQNNKTELEVFHELEKDLNKFLEDGKPEKKSGLRSSRRGKMKLRKATQMTTVGKGVCLPFSAFRTEMRQAAGIISEAQLWWIQGIVSTLTSSFPCLYLAHRETYSRYFVSGQEKSNRVLSRRTGKNSSK